MRKSLVLVAFLGALAFGPSPAAAEPVVAATVSTELSAQSRQRPRIRVTPRGGRLLYRDCDFRLVQEWRPSGTVIVPRQRCWWVRG